MNAHHSFSVARLEFSIPLLLITSCLTLLGPWGLVRLNAEDQAASTNSLPDGPRMEVPRCDDFEVDGTGKAAAWNQVRWTDLQRREQDGLDYSARVKMLYSANGVYVLMEGTDRRLTATFTRDFENLWTEDVFEVFLWTDPRFPLYFEYEISPLGYELPILIPNLDGTFLGWRPWHYEGERKTRKGVTVQGGPQESGATIEGWRAEMFFPYELFRPLTNVPPKPGTEWRANFYRVDHDQQPATTWDWARVGPSFHEYKKFGRLIFQ